jgi:hypothetical protein
VAGSEQTRIGTAGTPNITQTFNHLSTFLLKAALGRPFTPDKTDSVIECLKPSINAVSKVAIIACASPSPQFVKESLPAVKFCSKIRSAILSKLQEREEKRKSHNNRLSRQNNFSSNNHHKRFMSV